MTRFIGIKELQKNTKKIREEVERGTRFIVIYRSKPVFEIKPLANEFRFVDDLSTTGIYTDDFIKGMEEAEKNIKESKLKTYTTEA